MIRHLALTALLSCFCIATAHAQTCTAGLNQGQARLSASVMQVCTNAGAWTNLGQGLQETACAVGDAGRMQWDAVNNQLDYCNGTRYVNMNCQVGDPCAAGQVGTQRWNSATSQMEFCNGTNWRVMSGGACNWQNVLTSSQTVSPPNTNNATYYGYSVDIDGDYMIVGAPYAGFTAANIASTASSGGAAYIFHWNGSSWDQQAVIQPDKSSYNIDGSDLGMGVAINGDTVVIGANGYSSDAGAAFVYRRSGSTWNFEAMLRPSDLPVDASFGNNAVDISGDVIIVGARYYDSLVDPAATDSGAAYIFRRSGSTWTQQAKLLPPTPYLVGYFGWSVGVSGDYAVVGSEQDDAKANNAGAVDIYHYSAGAWTLDQRLTGASLTSTSDNFGTSVSIDGTRLAVGAYEDEASGRPGSSGVVYIFERGGSWTETALLYASDGASGDRLGGRVELSGTRLVTGALNAGATDNGAAYTFTYNGSVWSQEQKFTDPNPSDYGFFGSGVGLSGSHLAIGAYVGDGPTDENDVGTAYTWENSGAWSGGTRLVPSTPLGSTAVMGYSVDISGDWAFVGAHNDDTAGYLAGAVYVYHWTGSTWSNTQILTPPVYGSNTQRSDNFGYSLSLSGTVGVVGAVNGSAAYVYRYNGSSWVMEQKLTGFGGEYGTAVATDGTHIIVSAPSMATLAPYGGAVYIYSYGGGTWTLDATFNGGQDTEQWGNAINTLAINGNIAVVGAYLWDNAVPVNSVGRAYVFRLTNGTWAADGIIESPEQGSSNSFGQSVAVKAGAPDTIAVGCLNCDAGGAGNGGAIYIYTYNGSAWALSDSLFGIPGSSGARVSDSLGQSVDFGTDALAACGSAADASGLTSGRCYSWHYNGNKYVQDGNFLADVATRRSLDRFGFDVAIDGNNLLVGAYLSDNAGPNTGTAYFFTRQ